MFTTSSSVVFFFFFLLLLLLSFVVILFQTPFLFREHNTRTRILKTKKQKSCHLQQDCMQIRRRHSLKSYKAHNQLQFQSTDSTKTSVKRHKISQHGPPLQAGDRMPAHASLQNEQAGRCCLECLTDLPRIYRVELTHTPPHVCFILTWTGRSNPIVME